MNEIKTITKKLLGEKTVAKIKGYRNSRILRKNYIEDFKLYKKHSSVFKKDTFNKKESEITLLYHSIEKGFLYDPIRFRFAERKIKELIEYLKSIDLPTVKNRTHIQAAILNLCVYYDIHQKNRIDISDYFPVEDYEFLKSNLNISGDPMKSHTKDTFFKSIHSDFKEFSSSRSSVRNFTGEKISVEIFQQAVDLANNAPSVCNRQSVSVYLLENKEKINSILKIQGGLKGYDEKLAQLIVLTSDRNYFYSIGERNQLFIDGGIYLMNLLYALHYYKIGACPAHWGMTIDADKKVQNILGLRESEKIICLIAVGIPEDNFKTTLSLRRPTSENLHIID
ncbi:MAG: nitroreductase family protein [Bacteroidales bacterium]|nr:nitroreductase family protein [Bacteroidales bacterium]